MTYRVAQVSDDPNEGCFILDQQGNNCVNSLVQKYVPEAHALNPKIMVLSKFTAEVVVRSANLREANG